MSAKKSAVKNLKTPKPAPIPEEPQPQETPPQPVTSTPEPETPSTTPVTLETVRQELQSLKQLVGEHTTLITQLQETLARKRKPVASNGKVQIRDKQTGNEEFKDLKGNSIFRPRENVVFELGAASYKYDQRIVIFKEKGVMFPSDFSDLGYIEYDKEQLAGKTMDLLKELIALKAVKILPGS